MPAFRLHPLGYSSIRAPKQALQLASYVVLDGSFGADLGAGKFLNIKGLQHGRRSEGMVIVAAARRLKMHDGGAKSDLAQPNPPAAGKKHR